MCHRKCRDSRLNKISKMALLLHRIRSLLAHFAVFASSSYCNLKSSSWYCTGLLALELEWGIGAGLCAPRGGRDHGNKQPLHKIHRNNRPKSTSVRSLLAVSLALFSLRSYSTQINAAEIIMGCLAPPPAGFVNATPALCIRTRSPTVIATPRVPRVAAKSPSRAHFSVFCLVCFAIAIQFW